MSNTENDRDEYEECVNQDPEIAETFVNTDELYPDRSGAVPLYSSHPPDTVLPTCRCPSCGETAPTMKDLWRLYKRREQLLAYKKACEYPSDEWTAYNEGIQQTNRRISRITRCLPSEMATWLRRQIDPWFWETSELNPTNYGGGSNE